ncbi:MAG: DUF4256 domain-containing protein [Sphingobacteriales bacterium]|nr:MAG: DUF4256 domain-containing protein [Sphingobacteriales bacterium]
MATTPKINAEETEALLAILEKRFKANEKRHKGIDWAAIEVKLRKTPAKLWSLQQMEASGGEPDLVVLEGETGFCDCAAESPKGRRSTCYDQEALDARKENKPADSAVGMAKEMGITLLDETQYRALQELGKFDQKTSSWIQTPANIRAMDGALFCDRRYETVFLYHNGASSYYAARGFRAFLKL